MTEKASTLRYETLCVLRTGLTRDLPPGKEDLAMGEADAATRREWMRGRQTRGPRPCVRRRRTQEARVVQRPTLPR